MEHCKRAIHLRTGDRATDGSIGAWLDRHGIDVVSCADPFEACTLALTQPKPAPSLALVGADSLTPDELSIVGYLRETWPHLAVVVYGSVPATAGLEEARSTVVCHSAGAVRRMLEDPPSDLLDRSRGSLRLQASLGDDWHPQPDGPAIGVPRPDAMAGWLSHETSQPENHAGLTCDGATEGARPVSDSASPEGAEAPCGILTPEELAALLEGNKE